MNKKFYDYHVWANKRVFTHLKSLPEGICDKELDSGFPSISAVLKHIYLTDFVWLQTMQGSAFDETRQLAVKKRGLIQELSLQELEAEYEVLAHSFNKFFQENKSVMDQGFTVKHPELGEVETTLADLALHVSNHGTYHRGNITTMLRQIGHPGPSTDYVYFIYEHAKQ
ncbi:DinB family protein [Falsibacillus albus]|nr:DinB family protein [Falsibacillus albus]